MRKNGINRQLTPILGGICAPKGFQTGAITAGDTDKMNTLSSIALLLADRKFPAAFIGADCTNVGASVALSNRHLQDGVASAVLLHNGTLNTFGKDAEWLAERIGRALAAKWNVDRNDAVLISVGSWGKLPKIDDFENLLTKLHGHVGKEVAHADAFAGIGGFQQLAYSFQLGDVTCTIGATFTSVNQSPNVCILTTDVEIEPKMLQKALHTAVADCWEQLDKEISINDSVCILASGAAGNWKIASADSDYKKFTYALTAMMEEIALAACGKNEEGKTALVCKVQGAKSKRTAKELSKALAVSKKWRARLSKGIVDEQALLRLITLVDEPIAMGSISVSLQSSNGTVVVYEDGAKLPCISTSLLSLIDTDMVELVVDLQGGNYMAKAFSCLR